MSTYRRILAASAAAILSSGLGFATTVLAQVASGPPQPSPGTPTGPTAPGQGSTAPASAASVQSNFRRDATLSVSQRPREGYEARGIRLGALLIYPQVTVAAVADDNIYATATNETRDTIWRVSPQVSVSSDWIRHALSAYLRGTINRYQDHSTENANDYGGGVSGRLDVTRDTQATGRVDFTRATEPRSSANSPTGAVEPVQYDLWTVGATGRHEFNRLLASGRIEAQRYEYTSPPSAAGGVIDQRFRDRTLSKIGGRLDYAVSPATALFVDLSADKHEYKHEPAAGSASRDSSGVQALAGVNFEITSLTRGDIGVGYIDQSFDDPAARNLKGFSANVQVEWFPTQLTTVTFSGSRSIADSAVPGAPAYLSTNVGAHVDHELLRNVLLSGQVGYGRDEYTGIEREDRRKSAGVGVNYLINRRLGVSLTYDYSEQKTHKGVGNNFNDNRVAATLTVQY